MNKYDERYEIRLAKPSEIDEVMDFIDTHWKKGHIMAHDRRLFEYEFLDGDHVNVMVAIDKNTQTIEAFCGFLLCSHTSDSSKKDIWGSFWKVNNSMQNMTFLGVELIKRLLAISGCRSHLGIGINPNTTLPIRKIAFHEKTARMSHFYCLNPAVADYKIAVVNERHSHASNSARHSTPFVEFFSIDEIRACFDIEKLDAYPYKDFWYINKRFFMHPYYKYMVYGLKNVNQEVAALLVMREVTQSDRKVLRIVDYIGEQELFAGTHPLFDLLMRQNMYEYIDFYTFGFNPQYILDAGFVEKDDSDTNIIPNYFEPFLQQNVDIWVRYSDDRTVFCKADGDQDRPNSPHSL